MRFQFRFLISIGSILVLNQCNPSYDPGTTEHIFKVTSQVNDERLLTADETPGDWLSYGRNYFEDRFSPLQQITIANIDRLGLAWSLNLGIKGALEATPLVVDGIMYVTGSWSEVFAIDARKGELLWKFDPKVPRIIGFKACCGSVNRGVALYRGMVYVGALDGRLIAIDAASGKLKWETITVDTTANYTITGAPRVVAGNVIIGNGGAEYGVRGYVSGYDAMTGEQKWRTYTVPGDPDLPFESKAMEEAAATWTGEWWKYGGGGTVWDAMAYDPDLDLLYVGVGNGSPWPRVYRSPEGGDNLYLSSILALDPQNGEIVWYYQTTPGDNWDYTATQHMILADLNIEGQKKKVIMQAPKNGFFYVLDRTNGDFISAESYVYVNWASGIDQQTGRPIENEWSRYETKDVQIFPSNVGGHNWQPMAYNPETGFVYIPSLDRSMVFGLDPDWKFDDGFGGVNWGTNRTAPNPEREVLEDASSPQPDPQGRLVAWDPINQKEAWSVAYHENWWNSGVLTTSGGLVFQGLCDGSFIAYDAKNGNKVWEINLRTGIMGSPVSFEIDGIQYISVAVGWGAWAGNGYQFTEYSYPGTVYTFTLGKNTPIPDYPMPDSTPRNLADFEFEADEEMLARGMTLYEKYCNHCHWDVARETVGVVPDLGYINQGTYNSFEAIVLEGLRSPNGMPNFKDLLTKEDVAEIKNYILASTYSRRIENE